MVDAGVITGAGAKPAGGVKAGTEGDGITGGVGKLVGAGAITGTGAGATGIDGIAITGICGGLLPCGVASVGNGINGIFCIENKFI